MCLLVTSTSSNLRNVMLGTAGLIEDIYSHNKDGLGVMYHTTKGMKVIKLLPQSAEETRKLIEALPADDRMVACHWRMRTHGDINKENCHPYPIGNGGYMMHNGILHTGNKKDATKSDTWHFAKDYMSTLDADMLHNPQYLKLLGEYIENNRFVVATADGRMSWVNSDQGVEAAGITFSNTYAWSPEILMPEYRSRSMYATGYSKWWNAPAYQQLTHYTDDEGLTEAEDLRFKVANAVLGYDEKALENLLRSTDKEEVIDAVLEEFMIEETQQYTEDDWTVPYIAATKAWIAGDWKKLSTMSSEVLANSLMYCCDITPVDEDIPAWDEDEMEPIDHAFVNTKEIV